jgi:ribosome modulation factor
MNISYYLKGYRAYHSGKDYANCPYAEETAERYAWQHGFIRAQVLVNQTRMDQVHYSLEVYHD